MAGPFECPICPICTEPFGSDIHHLGCNHFVCEPCWKTFVEYQEAHGKDVLCPMCQHLEIRCARQSVAGTDAGRENSVHVTINQSIDRVGVRDVHEPAISVWIILVFIVMLLIVLIASGHFRQ